MPSLRFVLDAPLNFQESPDLFCLDLYKDFDLDRLAAMAAPATLTIERHVEVHPKYSMRLVKPRFHHLCKVVNSAFGLSQDAQLESELP